MNEFRYDVSKMVDESSFRRGGTALTDMEIDSLAHCASYLKLQDVSNLAMSCKYLNTAAYSDTVWQSLFRKKWPHPIPLPMLGSLSVREAYIYRHTSLQQFKYVDPLVYEIPLNGRPPKHMLFDRDNIFLSPGSTIGILRTNLFNEMKSPVLCGVHNARITCMRLFPSSGTSIHQYESGEDDILVTSSCDHSIRLWLKGGGRCFKGHTSPVLTLSDKLLDDGIGKILASGGEDGTVRLWSINSTGKRGQHALKATLYGHEKAVSYVSVAGHNTSLLVSLSSNGKVKVWDSTSSSSTARASCCVGSSSVNLTPIGLKCHESLLYIAGSSSIIAIDLRTMQRVSTIVRQKEIHSFEILPSKSLICSGGSESATLWDTRKSSDTCKLQPIAELDGHEGPVKFLHMDPYKIVTGGPSDCYVNVWETDTGIRTNSLHCHPSLDCSAPCSGCAAMAVDGQRIVTST